jgi:hypothetical protein
MDGKWGWLAMQGFKTGRLGCVQMWKHYIKLLKAEPCHALCFMHSLVNRNWGPGTLVENFNEWTRRTRCIQKNHITGQNSYRDYSKYTERLVRLPRVGRRRRQKQDISHTSIHGQSWGTSRRDVHAGEKNIWVNKCFSTYFNVLLVGPDSLSGGR